MDENYEYKLSLNLNGYEIVSRSEDLQCISKTFQRELTKLQINLEEYLVNVNAAFLFVVRHKHKIVKKCLAVYNFDIDRTFELSLLVDRFAVDLNLPELIIGDFTKALFIEGILKQTNLSIGFTDRTRFETVYMEMTGAEHKPVDLSVINYGTIEMIKLSKDYYEYGVEFKRIKVCLRKTIYKTDETELLNTFANDKFYNGYEIEQ